VFKKREPMRAPTSEFGKPDQADRAVRFGVHENLTF
jgi:hypothetical protein